ncbi:MAG: alpha-glucosidase [Mesorhizobium sp.]|nr:MAG: alpha-glucosidase [Mesorhizobium sp.]
MTKNGLAPGRDAVAQDWWRGATVYMVYIRSFMDGNGDGVGDLPGLLEKAEYIASLGVDAVWISPFFVSPMKDFGYDVAHFTDVDPVFGTLADFDAVVTRFHKFGVKVLLDMVVSHTSDQHPWFGESRADRTNPRADWYVWADAKADGSPPNNWLSVFGGSAWQWDPRRGQYYLHNFLRSQPDLNYHNPDVPKATLAAFEFWLRRGVDGFRLDTADYYFHDSELRDNPAIPEGFSGSTAPRSNPYAMQLHSYQKMRPENLGFLHQLRALMKLYGDAVLIGELPVDQDEPQWTRSYTSQDRLHTAYTFRMVATTSPDQVRNIVTEMEEGIGDGWHSWALSSLDVRRVLSRWAIDDPDRAAPLLMALLACLRGTALYYQGEELGFSESEIAFDQLQDPYGIEFWPTFTGRDGCRTPIAWTSGDQFGGFSGVRPWLPVDATQIARSVESQEGDPESGLNRLRRFLAWRKEHLALRWGSVRFLDAPKPVLALIRETGDDVIAAVFNPGSEAVEFDAPELASLSTLAGHGFTGSASNGRIHLKALDAVFLGPASLASALAATATAQAL